jgi:hypothetical protein
VSYDTNVCSIGIYEGFAGADVKTYQYDMLGKIDNVRPDGPISNTAWFSNIFTATENHSIKAGGLYTSGPGATYEISIRRGVGSTPVGGILATNPQTGTLGSPGYHRINLSSPVGVGLGEKFAVIVKLTDPGSGGYPVGFSYAYPGYTDGATATLGVGWISSNGTEWEDIADGPGIWRTASVCLKAFADIGSTAQVSRVELNKTSTALSVGDAETLIATVLPASTINKNVKWISSNTSIATVSDSGLVRGIAVGTATITATSEADGSKFAICAVTVNPIVAIFVFPKALFANDSAPLQASVVGLANTGVTWFASHGSISQAAGVSATYIAPSNAPPPDGRDTITAASVEMPAMSGQAKILIRPLDFAKFDSDNNTKLNPQLLDLANAFGSTSKADLDKYDFNGDGVIDDEDLAMLFKAMGW